MRPLCWGLLVALIWASSAAAETALDQRLQADEAYRQGNFPRAAELYRALALHHRDPDSQFMWGRMGLEGLSGGLSAEAARNWIERAAEQDSLAAMHWLAEHAAGAGPAGAREAARWLRRAAELGDVRAMAALLERSLDARERPDSSPSEVADAQLLAWAQRVAAAGEPVDRLMAIRGLRALAPDAYDERRRALQSLLNTVRLARDVRAAAAAQMAAELRAADEPEDLQYFWARVALAGGHEAPVDTDTLSLGLPRPSRLALDEGVDQYWARHPDAPPAPVRIVDRLTARGLPDCGESRALADRIAAAFRSGATEQQARESLLAEAAADSHLSRRLVRERHVGGAVADFYAADGLSAEGRHTLIAGRCR